MSTQAADRDFYRITADARAMLEIDTATPADGTGAFANTFDPIIRLYDAAGNLVASNDNGSADGRNASLKYKVPVGAGGTYYVEVSASPLTAAPTRGEYVLMIKGDSAPAAGHSASAAVAVAAATAAPAVAAAGTVSGGDRPGIWWVDLTAGAVPGGDQLTPTAGPAKGMTAAVRSESAAGVDGGPTPGVTARSLSPLTRLDFAPPDGVGRSDAATVDPLGWGVWLGG